MPRRGAPVAQPDGGQKRQAIDDSASAAPGAPPIPKQYAARPHLSFKQGRFAGRRQLKGGKRLWKNVRQIGVLERFELCPPNQPTYAGIEASLSLLPAKHFADVSGFVAPYRDPKTRLWYSDVDEFQRIRDLSTIAVQGFLELRGAHTVLK